MNQPASVGADIIRPPKDMRQHRKYTACSPLRERRGWQGGKDISRDGCGDFKDMRSIVGGDDPGAPRPVILSEAKDLNKTRIIK